MTRWFRKHSKILMVILAVFAMAVFGLGDAIFQLTRPSGSADGDFKDEVVATWGNNQEIKQSDLGLMLARHYQVQRFLERVVNAAQAAKTDFRPLAALVPPIQGDEKTSRAFVNEQLVERFILARKAEKEGVVYTEAMVDEYINNLSGQAGFSKVQLAELNREANSNQASLEVIRRHLRQELLAQQMRILSSTGFQLVANPTEGAELYQQYSEMVQCDVMPVSVDQFSNLTQTPSPADLKKIYDQGKYEYPDPTGKRPGFKRPNRIAVQYIMADTETFFQNEMNKLTAQQVQEEYDRLVAAKDNLVMEDVPATEPTQPENPAPATPPAANGEAKPETPTTSEAKPTEGNPTTPTPLPVTPATAPETPAEEKKDDSQADDSQAEDKKGGLSGNSVAVPTQFQYVSLKQEAEPQSSEPESVPQEPNSDKPAEEKPAEEKPAEPTAEAAEQASAAGDKQDSDKPADDKPAQDKPADTNAGNSTAPSDNPAPPAQQDPAGSPAENKPQDTVDLFAEEKAPERRPRPLADVSDRVKRKLVAQTVTANIEKAMKLAEEELEIVQSDIIAWESSSPETRGNAPVIEYQEIAKRLGLAAGETELVDFETFGQRAIGKAFIRPNQYSFGTIAQRIFGEYDRMNKFSVERQTDLMNGNQYLYWLTEKEDAVAVPFEECKDDVEKFWKQTQMVAEAVKKAKGIADEINASKAKLKVKYGETVTSTGEFTWYNTAGQPDFGQPQGVTKPGQEFMKSVFALSTNGCGVAVNADQTVVYVVQMISERKPVDVLGTEYVENQFLSKKSVPGEVQQLMLRYAQNYNVEFNQELLDEMGLKFLGQ